MIRQSVNTESHTHTHIETTFSKHLFFHSTEHFREPLVSLSNTTWTSITRTEHNVDRMYKISKTNKI